MIIAHDVADVDQWLSFRDDRVSSIAATGGTDIVGHAAHDDSNSVAITREFGDVDVPVSGLASPPPELAATVERHGVLPPLKVYVEG